MHQLSRLAIVFAVLIAGLVAARTFFVPESFGEVGHYRSAAIDDIVAQPLHYAGHQICFDCHDDIFALKQASYHRGLNCEVCHGPSSEHVENYEIFPPAPRERGFCPLCHAYNPSRPTGFPQIDPETHNLGAPCITCHNPHDPVPLYTPEECSACHGQIARIKAVSPHAPLPCQQCHETPEEHKINPRLARLQPSKPVTRDLCGGCHAEGAQPPLDLETPPPPVDLYSHYGDLLCWDCHYPHRPEVN